MTTAGSPTELQLVLLRSIYESAVENARAGDDVRLMTSMLLFDLAIEQAVRLALGPSGNGQNLHEMLEALGKRQPSLQGSGPLVEARKLRKARNSVMHDGMPPSATAVALANRVAEDALDAIVRTAFGRDFRTASLVAFLRSWDVRTGIERTIARAAEGDLVNALLFAGGTYELLQCRWGKVIRPSLGHDPEHDFSPYRLDLAAATFGNLADVWIPGPAEKFQPQVIATMGFDASDLPRIDRLHRLAYKLLRASDEKQEMSRMIADARVSAADLDFWIDRLARVAWRLETHHPDVIPVEGEGADVPDGEPRG